MSEPIIVSTPGVCSGQPRINGTRITVATMHGWARSGYHPDVIRAEYPQLTLEQIQAAIDYPLPPEDDSNYLADATDDDLRQMVADLRRERDEANERTKRITNRAMSMISRLCPDHLTEAKEMSFGVFMERTEKNGCEWCAVARAESAERERSEAIERAERAEWTTVTTRHRAETAERERDEARENLANAKSDLIVACDEADKAWAALRRIVPENFEFEGQNLRSYSAKGHMESVQIAKEALAAEQQS